MSDHTWVLENLAAYLADGLEPAERERLDRHTAECATCAAALTAAREMDTTLTGLFAASRPSAILEDRVIQALRSKSQKSEWRLPMPAWLAIAAAALLLLGFTGAITSSLIVQGGLTFPGSSGGIPTGSMASDLLGYRRESRTDVAQLAEESRQKALANLDGTVDAKNLNSYNELYFYPPAQALSVKASSTIHSRSSNLIVPPSIETATGQISDATANRVISNGSQPSNGKLPPDWMPGSGGGAGGPTPTGPVLQTFSPSKLLDQAVAQEPGKSQPVGGPSQPPQTKENAKDRKSGDALDVNQVSGPLGNLQDKEKDNKKLPDKPDAQPGARKIVIRTGEIEYEVASFDAAVATITRLVKPIKSGFIATVNSDKLANGKVRGSVVVRVPPEQLDALILDLRTNLGKNGELKNQRITSLDIGKQYTDLESRLRAARAMEERLLQIIKTGKGEIKDLLAVEKELGEWRTRIENIEGELRYYANQVALSTLTITLYEKEIQAPFGVIETERVQMGLEVDAVDEALRAAQKAVREAKGRITRSELKQHPAGQVSAILNFEVAPDAAGPMRDRLRQLGTVSRLDIDRLEATEGGTGKPTDGKTTRSDARFIVSFYNLANVAPRETAVLQIACADVAASYRAVQEAVVKAKGRIRNGQLNEQDRHNITGTLDFEVFRSEEAVVLAALTAAGDTYTRNVTRAPDAENFTDSKVHWQLTLINQARIPPRETFVFGVEVSDVDQTAAMLSALVGDQKERIIEANISRERSGRVTGKLVYDVPMAKVHELIERLKGAGNVRVQQTSQHPEVPDSALAIARLDVTLSNVELLVPSDEGFAANLRRGLSTSFTALSWSLSVVIVGLCVFLPWALVIWAIYRLVVRWRRKANTAPTA